MNPDSSKLDGTKSKAPKSRDRASMVYMAMGFEIIGFIIAGYLIGSQIDSYFGLRGLGVIFSVIGSIVLFIVHLVTVHRRLEAQQASEDKTL